MFNALRYTEELEKAGFTRIQAEVSLKLLIDTMNENFATKDDLHATKIDLQSEIKELAWQLRSEIKAVETRLDSKIQSLELKTESGFRELEYKLTIKLGTLMTIAVGMTATLVKLLH